MRQRETEREGKEDTSKVTVIQGLPTAMGKATPGHPGMEYPPTT